MDYRNIIDCYSFLEYLSTKDNKKIKPFSYHTERTCFVFELSYKTFHGQRVEVEVCFYDILHSTVNYIIVGYIVSNERREIENWIEYHLTNFREGNINEKN